MQKKIATSFLLGQRCNHDPRLEPMPPKRDHADLAPGRNVRFEQRDDRDQVGSPAEQQASREGGTIAATRSRRR
jgi:hypothetical protein